MQKLRCEQQLIFHSERVKSIFFSQRVKKHAMSVDIEFLSSESSQLESIIKVENPKFEASIEKDEEFCEIIEENSTISEENPIVVVEE